MRGILRRNGVIHAIRGLIVTPEGLLLAYEIFDGNRNDVTTVDEIIEMMREKYGHERRVWVMDRGMVSEDDLEMMRECGASYLVATPSRCSRRSSVSYSSRTGSRSSRGVEVKICQAPQDTRETFVLCRSPQRRGKEHALRERQIKGLEEGLARLKARIEAPTRTLRHRDRANRRIGRMFQRFSRAAHLYDVEISEIADPDHKSGKRLSIDISVREDLRQWVEQSDGCYLLRTNIEDMSAEFLWKTYTGLTQIEDCFRITKYDLGLRPIFHHDQERVQAHILVCFLALVMWRTLQQWMEGCGLGTARAQTARRNGRGAQSGCGLARQGQSAYSAAHGQ